MVISAARVAPASPPSVEQEQDQEQGQDRERQAFQRALVQVRPVIDRRARMLEPRPAAADDLVQDTLERALQRWTRFRPGSNLCAWVLVMMQNLFFDGRRSQRVRAQAGPPPPPEAPPLPDEDPPPTPPSELVDPADVPALLARLSTPLRQTVQLVLVEGTCYRDAAARLGVPVGTVGTRVARARAQLRDFVSADAGPVPSIPPRAPLHSSVSARKVRCR
jgi:RNA polymerase sigma-70 factor, ECF subfamily